jgi:hypothetical protein
MKKIANEFAAKQTSTTVDLLRKLLMGVCARQFRLSSPKESRRASKIHTGGILSK